MSLVLVNTGVDILVPRTNAAWLVGDSHSFSGLSYGAVQPGGLRIYTRGR